MCLYNRQWSDTKQRRKLSFNGQEHFFAVSQIVEKDDNDLKLPEMLPIMQPPPPSVRGHQIDQLTCAVNALCTMFTTFHIYSKSRPNSL